MIIKNVTLNVLLNNEIIKEEEIELTGNEQKTLTVKNLTTSGILKAEIQTDDFLFVDNVAYTIINEIRPINIVLISDDNMLNNELEKIEYTTNRIRLTRIDAPDYEPGVMKNYDVAIFNNVIPDYDPGINSLYILSSHSVIYTQTDDVNGGKRFSDILVPELALVENVKILDWDNTHPTMKHLDNLDDLNIKNALIIRPPDWSIPLIKIANNLNDSPIAFAGQYAGNKIITLGFDLSAFDFSKSNDLRILIMTLNIIQWLNPYEVEGHNRILTGGQYVPSYAIKGNIEILNPKGEIFKYNKEDTEAPFVFNDIEYIGEYEISADDFNDRFVANLFDENESMIEPDSTDDKDFTFKEKEAVTLIQDKKNEFGKYLLLLVPFILVIEWLLYYRRVRAGTA